MNRHRLSRRRAQKIARFVDLLKLRAEAQAVGQVEISAGLQQIIEEELAPSAEFVGVARAVLDDPEFFGVRA